MSVELVREGGLVWLEFGAGRGNVLDAAQIDALAGAVQALAQEEEVRCLAFTGKGRDFCWGASVPEHQKEQAPGMLATFHAFFRLLEGVGIPTAAAVSGRCLGGGLELAAWCGRVAASPDAQLALPEIKLAVFPPMGTLALDWRVGGAAAAELVYTGRTVSAAEAAALGLVDEVAEDPRHAVRRWYEERLAALSASSLRYAWRAARLRLARRLDDELPALERLYLDGLMNSFDANEGIEAFLQKRPARYQHR